MVTQEGTENLISTSMITKTSSANHEKNGDRLDFDLLIVLY